jgi:hypothetical protein
MCGDGVYKVARAKLGLIIIKRASGKSKRAGSRKT